MQFFIRADLQYQQCVYSWLDIYLSILLASCKSSLSIYPPMGRFLLLQEKILRF